MSLAALVNNNSGSANNNVADPAVIRAITSNAEHNDVRAVTYLPYFSFKIATTLNQTYECKTVSYWLKF